MIDRVEPKIVDLVKRLPGVTIQTCPAAATMCSSCTAIPHRSTITTCGWH